MPYDASYAQVAAAVEAGASMATHLFNAQSQIGNREPGLVGAVLDLPGLDAGIIADGIHVHPTSLGIALRAKRGPGQIFLVSDAMSITGTDWTEFELTGRTVYRKDGALRLADGTQQTQGVLDLEKVRLQWDPYSLTEVEGELTFTPAEIKTEKVTGLLHGSPLELRGVLRQYGGAEASFDLVVQSPGMRAGIVSSLLLEQGSLQDAGIVRGSMRFRTATREGVVGRSLIFGGAGRPDEGGRRRTCDWRSPLGRIVIARDCRTAPPAAGPIRSSTVGGGGRAPVPRTAWPTLLILNARSHAFARFAMVVLWRGVAPAGRCLPAGAGCRHGTRNRSRAGRLDASPRPRTSQGRRRRATRRRSIHRPLETRG